MKKSNQTLGLMLFIFSMLLGFGLNALAVYSDLESMSFWGNPEGTSFDSTLEMDGRLGSLRCPVILSIQESKWIKITVKNPTDHAITPAIQASISDPTQLDNILRDKQELTLEPGGKVELTWQVGKENRLFNRVVYVRVFLFRSIHYPPSITRNCGIVMADFGDLTGNQIVGLVFSASLGGMLLGILLWRKNHPIRTRRETQGFGVMLWLTGITGLNILANLAGWPVGAGMLLLLTILLFLATFETLFTNPM
jgi:hypothetical protein